MVRLCVNKPCWDWLKLNLFIMADQNVLKQSSKRQTRTEEAAALIPLGCAEAENGQRIDSG